MSSPQSDECVNVIFDTADTFRHAAEVSNNAAQICVQAATPPFVHVRRAVFCAED